MHQITIFELLEDNKVCKNCAFWVDGVCAHIKGEDFGCENGSFKIRKSKAVCPGCNSKLNIRQARLGGDYAICRKCNRQIDFKNNGNRLTAFQMWKAGAGLRGE